MPLFLRRIIYLAFIAVFLIVAPLIALYSMGYRYHWGKHRFEQTGLILVDGTPQDARVLVDGVVRATHLPARIGGLGPNEYRVRVERDGYSPWERRLAVVGGQTTFADAIVLFRTGDPTLALPGSIGAFAVSADGAWAAVVRAREGFDELWIAPLADAPVAPIIVLRVPSRRDTPMTLTWSPRGAQLLVTTPTDTLHVDPQEPTTPHSLRAVLSRPPTTTQWELASDEAIIAVTEGRLHRIHRATWRAVPLPVPIPPYPFAVGRNAVYTSQPYHDPHGPDTEVLAIPTDGGEPRIIVGILGGMITRFVDLRGTTLIAEQEARPGDITTVILNTTAQEHLAARFGTGRITHPNDPDAVAWRTDANELWVERGDDAQPKLLVRRDVPIRDIRWHPTQPYLFFATDTEAVAVALDAPAPQRTTHIAQLDHIAHIAVTQDGGTMLIVGRKGEEEGVFQLPLR